MDKIRTEILMGSSYQRLKNDNMKILPFRPLQKRGVILVILHFNEALQRFPLSYKISRENDHRYETVFLLIFIIFCCGPGRLPCGDSALLVPHLTVLTAMTVDCQVIFDCKDDIFIQIDLFCHGHYPFLNCNKTRRLLVEMKKCFSKKLSTLINIQQST